MLCKCKSMKVRVTGWRTDEYFRKFPKVGESNEGWSHILKCPSCNQHWLADEFDKIQSLLAVKIDNPEKVDQKEILEEHLKELLSKYGGNSKRICQFHGCNNFTVNKKAFCAECLITKQGVYE